MKLQTKCKNEEAEVPVAQISVPPYFVIRINLSMSGDKKDDEYMLTYTKELAQQASLRARST